LQSPQVGANDNFFALGGDSILAIRLVSKARRAGLHFSVQDLFQHQSVAALAGVAQTTRVEAPGALPPPGDVPLTPIQHWFFSLPLGRRHHFNQAVLLEARRRLDPALVEAAVAHLLGHHDALRLRFERDGSRWRQYYAESQELSEVCTRFDLSGLSGAAASRRLEREADLLQRRLDPERGPVLRVACFEMGEDEPQRLLLVAHHLVIDGVSWRVLVEDLEGCCRALLAGAEVELPGRTSSMRRWAEALGDHLGSEQAAQDRRYWLGQAESGGAGRSLPRDFEGGGNLRGAAREERCELSEERTRRLLRGLAGGAAAGGGARVQEVVVCAVAEAVCGWSGREEVVVEVEGHGREERVAGAEVSRTVGWFTTIYPVRVRGGGGGSVEERLGEAAGRLREARERGLGYGLLRHLSEEAGVREAMEGLWGGEVIVNYLGQFDQELGGAEGLFAAGRESVGAAQAEDDPRSHRFEVTGAVSDGRLKVTWSYGSEEYEAGTMQGLVGRFMQALGEIADSSSSGSSSSGGGSAAAEAAEAAEAGAEGEVEMDADLSPDELADLLAELQLGGSDE
jgi:non-ribosomal peptide synthase protein (TIGR01720 family)